MKIMFKKIRWRNIMSYGQMWTEIDLDRNPSTMILGTNGAGKSAITDALMFGLFGKPYRKVNKGQLINTKNGKDARVEIEFEVDGSEYKICRGMKPDIFEIYKDGELQNQPGSSRDYQKYLETTIMSMDYSAACQLMVVGKAQYQPFMQLDAGKRRKFVEMILNLVIYSMMGKIHYNRTYDLKNKLSELKSALQVADDKVKIRKQYISDLESAERAIQTDEINKITQAIRDVEDQIAELVGQKSEAAKGRPDYDEAGYKHAREKLNRHIKMLSGLDSKAKALKERLDAMGDVPSCYACGQSIDPVLFNDQKQKMQDQSLELEKARTEISLAIEQLESAVADFVKANERFTEYQSTIKEFDYKIRFAEGRLEQLKLELTKDRTSQSDKIEAAKKDLAELVKILTKFEEKYQEAAETQEYLATIGLILQDKGIKSMLIKRYIPIINQSVNSHLAQLGLFVKFALDENFDETIQSRGFDVLGYNSYSEGEKLRMDMALLLAWRDIAKMQGNVSTNLLIFDEIFDSSLDAGGAESLADLLTHTNDLNVFIITHTPEKIMDKVRSVIKINKTEGFSRLA